MEYKKVLRKTCKDENLEETLEGLLNVSHANIIAVTRIEYSADLDDFVSELDSWEIVYSVIEGE